MNDPFTALDADTRRSLEPRYLAHLRSRLGEIDVAALRLPLREAFLEDLARRPVRWIGPPLVEQAALDVHLAGYDPRAPVGEATLWALCVARVRYADRYAIERWLATHPRSPEDPELYIALEKRSHARLMDAALDALGLRVALGDPPFGQRLLIHAMVRGPEAIADVFNYCGDLVGLTIFEGLLAKARALFGSQPGPLARIEAIIAPIVEDFMGSVPYRHSRLEQGQLAAARRLLPAVVRGAAEAPESWMLFGRERFAEEVLRVARRVPLG
jgi:hypothetical protein